VTPLAIDPFDRNVGWLLMLWRLMLLRRWWRRRLRLLYDMSAISAESGAGR
jgi:hypothetical protein